MEQVKKEIEKMKDQIKTLKTSLLIEYWEEKESC